MSAIMLSFATLGNALKDIPYVRNICGIIVIILLLTLLCKIIFTFDSFKQDLKNPIIASVFVTFSMGLIVFATYIKPFSNVFGLIVWFLGIALYVVNACYVLFRFIIPTKRVLPSHYVTFVGVVVASVTSPIFSMQSLGFVICIIGFIFFVILTPFIFANLFKKDFIPTPALPTKTIVAAPLSLCLAGYISSASAPNITLVLIASFVALALTILGIYFMFSSIKKAFNPSYSAYTFPMVISAVAMKNVMAISQKMDVAFKSLYVVLYRIEIILAVLVVCLVFIAYIIAIIKSMSKEQSKTTA